MISVGKLDLAELANFAEIECFVLVACSENSLVDAKVSSVCTLSLPV
jgi:diphthamide biosynthesis protein 2